MGFGWAKTNNLSPIGIDFGASAIKLLQVQFSDQQPTLVAAASAEVPVDCRQDADKRYEFLRQVLPGLIKGGRFKGTSAVACIPATHTFIQHLRFNKVEEGMIQRQVEDELRGIMPVPVEQLVVRHVDVGQVMVEGATRREVICIATGREAVMKHVQAVAKAKLEIVSMPCESMAIVQAFSHLYRRASDEKVNTLFIDIGAATTKAVITHCRQIVLIKTIQVGGEQFIRQAVAELKLGEADARTRWIQGASTLSPTVKAAAARMAAGAERRNNNPAAELPMLAAGGLETPMEPAASTAVAVEEQPGEAPIWSRGELLDCLVEELRMCIGYHAAMFPDRPVSKIVFVGGEARQVEMCQHIARLLRLPAQLGDPLARLGKAAENPVLELEGAQPGWAVPLGLCLLPVKQ